MINRRRNNIVLNGQHCCHSLNGAGGTQQMTCHGLGRTDVQLVSCITEYLLDSLGLRDIAHVSRCAVYIDIVNILRLHACILQRILHDELGTQSFRMRSSDVVSIGTHAGTNHLSINLCTTGLGMLQFLKNQTACTFGHDETIAAGTERTTGLLGLIVTC